MKAISDHLHDGIPLAIMIPPCYDGYRCGKATQTVM